VGVGREVRSDEGFECVSTAGALPPDPHPNPSPQGGGESLGRRGMQALRFLFSPTGRLPAKPFVIAALVLYAVGLVSLPLTGQPAFGRSGLWLFAAVQALLTWIWYALHARRLHDAGRSSGVAAAIAVLYALSVVLLVLVGAAFFTASGSAFGNANAAGALGLSLLLTIIDAVSGPHGYDASWLVVLLLLTMAYVPIILAMALTLFAATRPSVK
jgi:uncharacterized membrane protein YhaH (DUF805 family)